MGFFACRSFQGVPLFLLQVLLQTAHDLGIGLLHAAQVPAEAVLIQLLVGLHIPQPGGIGADLVGQDDGAVG